MGGIGVFLWKISVALYLLTNGVLGLGKKGDYNEIFKVFGSNTDVFVTIAAIISLIAGIFVIMEMLNISIPIVDMLILVIAIIWAVFIVLRVISWIDHKFGWDGLAQIAIYLMVLSSLIVATKKFD